MSTKTLLRPKRSGFGAFQLLSLARYHTGTIPDAHFHNPSSLDLLQSILTASATSQSEPRVESSIRNQVLDLLDKEWHGNPPPSLWCSLKGVHPTHRDGEIAHLRRVTDLSGLKRVVEKFVIDEEGALVLQYKGCMTLFEALQRCEVHNTCDEIVTILNDITIRLARLDLPQKPQLFEIGMYYASLQLSAPNIERFFHGFIQSSFQQGTQSMVFAKHIIGALSRSVESAFFENIHFDTKILLTLMTGEPGSRSQKVVGLHEILRKAYPGDRVYFATYLQLLSILRSSSEFLSKSWAELYLTLSKEDQMGYHSAYDIVQTLLRTDQSETALILLEKLSTSCRNDLPHLPSFHGIQTLLDNVTVAKALPGLVSNDHFIELLSSCLENLEKRQGIEWKTSSQGVHGQHKAHHRITPSSPWNAFDEQPLPTINGDYAEYDSISRLFAGLQVHGSSKSAQDLGIIVELLHDHDGDSQRVRAKHPDPALRHAVSSKFSSFELLWRPQHSPIEFYQSQLPRLTDSEKVWTPASLGLIRASVFINGEARLGYGSLHLMQLGSLEMRNGPNNPWKPSGYIVAWDRQLNGMIALYVGKNSGVIDCGLTPSDGPLGTVINLGCSSSIPLNLAARYYLEVDPSLDLKP